MSNSMPICTQKERTELEKFSRIKETVKLGQGDWREAKRIYDEFKMLRASIGKPVVNKIDPKKVRRDLSSEDFFHNS